MRPTSLRPLTRPQAYICPRCIRRTNRRSLATSAPLRSSKFAILSNRRLIRLAGPDAASFLFNLLPAKILGVGTNPIYTAFLSAHGRILHDVFIYPPSWSEEQSEWFVEVDEEGVKDLLKHLKRHKLRSKFGLEAVDPEATRVVVQWGEQADVGRKEEERDRSIRAGGRDERPGMMQRLVLDTDREDEVLSGFQEHGGQSSTVKDYTIHRMLHGLAEGGNEIISGHALPQESNIDFLCGIDFHKGCYLGQELTIRTHHTGVVRKRILPVQLYESTALSHQTAPEYDPDANIELPARESNMSKMSGKRGRSTGKWLGGVGNIGLALCRLEMMTDIQLTADSTNYDPDEEYKVQVSDGKEVKLKPFVPKWVREGIEQSLKRKERKPAKKLDQDEDDEGE